MDNWKQLVKLGLVVGGLVCTSAHAGVKILDFDTDAHGRHISNAQIIDNEYLGSEFGVKINSCNFRGYASSHEINNALCNSHDIANRAVAFDTDNNRSKDDDLEFDNTNNDYKTQYTPVNVGGVVGASRPGNILVINEDWVNCNATHCDQANDEGSRPNGFVEFLFDDLVDIISLDFFDFEEGARNNRSRISFYEGNTEKTFGFVPNTGDGEFERITFNATGIDRLVVRYPGSGGIDNLVFRHHGGPNPVNAPGALALLVVGAALTMRRRIKR